MLGAPHVGHVVISKNLIDYIEEYSVTDNHLYSSHFPLIITLNINVLHNRSISKIFKEIVSWNKATASDIVKNSSKLDKYLNRIEFDSSIFACNSLHCSKHQDEISLV